MKTKKNKIILFFFIILTLFLAGFAFSLSPSDPSTVYLTSGDVIKNFKLESFDNSPISTGYTTERYGNKLVFGSGPYWEIDPDSVQLQYFLQEEDIVYFKYDVLATNSINMYTNCKNDDVSQSLTPTTSTYIASQYRHLALDGGTRFAWDGSLFWEHYDFYPTSDVRTYNSENNYFAGDLVMSFDIDSTPIPSSVVDMNGNVATKEFSHISIVSVYTEEFTHGFLSDETPEITGTTPDRYDPYDFEDDGNSVIDNSQSDMIVSYTFTPDTRLNTPYLANSFDNAVTPQPPYTSLNPTTKLGTALWDPQTENRSATDCEFTYHVTSLSPVVKEYSQQLSYNTKTVIAQDYIQWVLFVPFLKIQINEEVGSRQTQTEDVALQVSNRYIQADLVAKFSVFSAYKIEVLKDSNNITLGIPAEYFDYLAWSSAVDGFGGAEGSSEVPELINVEASIILLVIILGIAGVGIYVYLQFQKKMIPKVSVSIGQ